MSSDGEIEEGTRSADLAEPERKEAQQLINQQGQSENGESPIDAVQEELGQPGSRKGSAQGPEDDVEVFERFDGRSRTGTGGGSGRTGPRQIGPEEAQRLRSGESGDDADASRERSTTTSTKESPVKRAVRICEEFAERLEQVESEFDETDREIARKKIELMDGLDRGSIMEAVVEYLAGTYASDTVAGVLERRLDAEA